MQICALGVLLGVGSRKLLHVSALVAILPLFNRRLSVPMCALPHINSARWTQCTLLLPCAVHDCLDYTLMDYSHLDYKNIFIIPIGLLVCFDYLKWTTRLFGLHLDYSNRTTSLFGLTFGLTPQIEYNVI